MSEMYLVKDAEVIRAKRLTVPTALDCVVWMWCDTALNRIVRKIFSSIGHTARRKRLLMAAYNSINICPSYSSLC